MRNATWAVAALVAGLGQVSPLAQDTADRGTIEAIKTEGRERSQAATLFYTLTDVLGPRLTASPAHLDAAGWARDRFREWGVADPRLEPFTFGRGWTLESRTVEMTAPRYMPLIGYAEAWSPPTSGVLTGRPIYVGDSTAEEIDRLGNQLRGAIVLTHRPQIEFVREDRPQPGVNSEPVRTGNPPVPGLSSATSTARPLERLRASGAGVAVRPGAMEHGTVRVQGNRDTADDAVPSVIVAAEQ